MFNSNLIMAVKVNGKVLREFDGTVALPFGSEYSIFLKNVSNRRVSVDISIDGQDVLDGTSIIIDANSQTEIKRFIKNGNLDAGNAFKFIEKTQKIEEFRGNKPEDGLLTVTYAFEREHPYITYNGLVNEHSSTYGSWKIGEIGGAGYTTTSYTTQCVPLNNSTIVSTSILRSNSGITAPGSKVDQKFTPVYGFVADAKTYTMTIKMVGATEESVVAEPVTVKRKVRCTMCGTYCKQTAKFCHECGTSVAII